MRTEAQLLEEARRCRKKVIQSRNGKDGTISRHSHDRYLGRFDAVAWMLKREPRHLWIELGAVNAQEKIPLYERLRGLTNPTPSGMILEPKE